MIHLDLCVLSIVLLLASCCYCSIHARLFESLIHDYMRLCVSEQPSEVAGGWSAQAMQVTVL
jgi:hypothetical protein